MTPRDICGYLLDVDGVLYRGRRVLPGARALLATFNRKGIPFALVTNNSTRTPRQYARLLAAMGMRVPAEQIVTSSVGTAAYLRARLRPGARVLVIGEPPFRRAVARAGFILAWEDVVAVVVGLDRRVTYRKLAMAASALAAGAEFVASNPDPMVPTENGEIPGAGTLVSALQYASGKKPVVIGKPNPRLLLEAIARIGTRPSQTAMIGDQIGTDIAAGRAAGMFTILVLTGVTRRRAQDGRAPRPDLILRDLNDLRRWMAGRPPRPR